MIECIIECDYDFDEGLIAGEVREEVVRCKGCKFFREDKLGVFCTLFDFEDVDEERQRDGFCAWGERRD